MVPVIAVGSIEKCQSLRQPEMMRSLPTKADQDREASDVDGHDVPRVRPRHLFRWGINASRGAGGCQEGARAVGL